MSWVLRIPASFALIAWLLPATGGAFTTAHLMLLHEQAHAASVGDLEDALHGHAHDSGSPSHFHGMTLVSAPLVRHELATSHHVHPAAAFAVPAASRPGMPAFAEFAPPIPPASPPTVLSQLRV